MFTFLFLLASLVPFCMAALIMELAPDHNKWEASKPAVIGLIILGIGIYLDYKILIDTNT